MVPRGFNGFPFTTRRLGRPLTFSLAQTHTEIDRPASLLDRALQLRAAGAPIYPQVANRATGILIGLQSDEHTYSTRATYRALVHLPVAERAARLGRDPAELVYDLFLEQEGGAFLIFPFTNDFRGCLDDVHAMLTHPASVWGRGDRRTARLPAAWNTLGRVGCMVDDRLDRATRLPPVDPPYRRYAQRAPAE